MPQNTRNLKFHWGGVSLNFVLFVHTFWACRLTRGLLVHAIWLTWGYQYTRSTWYSVDFPDIPGPAISYWPISFSILIYRIFLSLEGLALPALSTIWLYAGYKSVDLEHRRRQILNETCCSVTHKLLLYLQVGRLL